MSKILPAVIIVILAAGAGFLLGGGWPGADRAPPALESATALFGSESGVPEFTLRDHTGEVYTRDDLDGRWTLFFFGYTHCPDICPITLATLARSVEALPTGNSDPPPRIVFVSVDPERDTAEHLRRYVTSFRDDFLGVTGPHEELRKLTRALKVVYARTGEGPDYLVEHSAALMLVNPDGELQAIFTPPHAPDAIARDFAAIRLHTDS